MGITFAIGDIHGRFDLMRLALDEIERQVSRGTVVFLGDYVDRGPQSMQVLDWLLAGPPAGFEWVVLQGNHEVMMIMAQDQGYLDWWFSNGGADTVKSYEPLSKAAAKEKTRQHLRFIKGLKLVHSDLHRVYAHAAVDERLPLEGVGLDQQDPEFVQWHRYGNLEDIGYNGKHVVHGHTPKKDGPVCLTRRTNMDVGAVFTGKLAIGVFDDALPGGPIDVLWVGA